MLGGKLVTGFGLTLCLGVMLSTNALPNPNPGERPTFSSRIVGGEIAPLGAVPYHVSILPGGVLGDHACSGSLLNEYWVITSARCVAMSDLFYMVVGTNTIGQNYWDAGYRSEYAESYFIHEQYDSYMFENDIALLKFRSPVPLSEEKRTAKIPLPPKGYEATGNVTVSGWGTTHENVGGLSQKLRVLTIPVVPQDECLDVYTDSILKDTMMCAGVKEGGKDRCQGDSGAPLVDSEGFLVGIASWGYGCARPGYPGVYTKVSAYRDWIDQKLAQN